MPVRTRLVLPIEERRIVSQRRTIRTSPHFGTLPSVPVPRRNLPLRVGDTLALFGSLRSAGLLRERASQKDACLNRNRTAQTSPKADSASLCGTDSTQKKWGWAQRSLILNVRARPARSSGGRNTSSKQHGSIRCLGQIDKKLVFSCFSSSEGVLDGRTSIPERLCIELRRSKSSRTQFDHPPFTRCSFRVKGG